MKKIKQPTENDILKYEIATNLGLSSKVDKVGWGGLTAAETGRIGGLVSSKKKKRKAKNEDDAIQQ